MNARSIRRALGALGMAMALTTVVACGSSGGDSAAKASGGSTVDSRASGSPESSGGGEPAATSVDPVCPLLDVAKIKAAYGGDDAKTNEVTSLTPKTHKNCAVIVGQPVKVMKVSPDSILTSVNLSLIAEATSEEDFVGARGASAKDIEPATKKAYWENDQYERHVVWFDKGVQYQLSFLTPGDAVDKAKGFAIMKALSKDIMAKT